MTHYSQWPARLCKARQHPIRLIVIHSMEAPEMGTTAESCARYFAGPTSKGSAHACVDNNSIVTCIGDHLQAAAAPGANQDGLHVELAGTARQTRRQWLDPYSVATMRNAAVVVANWCRRWDIPPIRLDATQVRAGRRGIAGHDTVNAAYGRSTHWDPGPNFPWDTFMPMVQHICAGTTDDDDEEDDMTWRWIDSITDLTRANEEGRHPVWMLARDAAVHCDNGAEYPGQNPQLPDGYRAVSITGVHHPSGRVIGYVITATNETGGDHPTYEYRWE